jgi:Zn-finger nucleic acid-binding protein
MGEMPVPVEAAGSAAVDVCDRCGGVFLEFFDGEPGSLARGVLEHLEQSPDAVEGGRPTCPDCGQPMQYVRYMKTGPHLARCGNCMGVFVTARQLWPLADFAPDARRSLWERIRNQIMADGGDDRPCYSGCAACRSDAGEEG